MKIDSSWRPYIEEAFDALSPEYKTFLKEDKNYFPVNWLAPFTTLPLDQTKAILFGQDPYPRVQSATGYAFIDGAVDEIFSCSGFSKKVNRATSLRNFFKMQLANEGFLSDNDVSQEAISSIDKTGLITTIEDLRINFEREGILLLNSALVFTSKEKSRYHAKEFAPFMKKLLASCSNRSLELILFGKMANNISKMLPQKHSYKLIHTPHPYNVDFIHDRDARTYFKGKRLMFLT